MEAVKMQRVCRLLQAMGYDIFDHSVTKFYDDMPDILSIHYRLMPTMVFKIHSYGTEYKHLPDSIPYGLSRTCEIIEVVTDGVHMDFYMLTDDRQGGYRYNQYLSMNLNDLGEADIDELYKNSATLLTRTCVKQYARRICMQQAIKGLEDKSGNTDNINYILWSYANLKTDEQRAEFNRVIPKELMDKFRDRVGDYAHG